MERFSLTGLDLNKLENMLYLFVPTYVLKTIEFKPVKLIEIVVYT